MMEMNKFEYQQPHRIEFERMVSDIHNAYVSNPDNKCGDIGAPEKSFKRMYPHEFLFLMYNSWDLLESLQRMIDKEMPKMNRRVQTFLEQCVSIKGPDFVDPVEVKYEVEKSDVEARNQMIENPLKVKVGKKKDYKEIAEQDQLYFYIDKQNMDDYRYLKVSDMIPRTKLINTQNR